MTNKEPTFLLPHACQHCGGDGKIVAVNPAWLRWKRHGTRVQLREVARRAGFSAAFVCDVEHGRRNCNAALLDVYQALKLEPRARA